MLTSSRLVDNPKKKNSDLKNEDEETPEYPVYTDISAKLLDTNNAIDTHEEEEQNIGPKRHKWTIVHMC